MTRRLLFVLLLFVATFGVAAAEQFFAGISKVDGNKVSFVRYGGKAEVEITLPAAKSVKVVRGSFIGKSKKVMPEEEIEGGLGNDRFKDIGPKGLFAQIITDADGKNITEIRLLKPTKEPKK